MDAWKPRQMIWRLKNFDRVKINDKYKVVCKACKDDGWGKYIFSAVTTNMVKHLEKQHHELFVKMKAMEAEDKIQKKCQSQEKLQLQPDNSILESDTSSNNNSSIIMQGNPDGTFFIPLPEVSEFDVNLNSAATFEEDTDMQLTPSFSVPTLEFKIPPTPESMESNNPSTPYTPGTPLNSIESLNPGTPSIIFSEPEESPVLITSLQSPKSQDFSNTVEAYFRQIQDDMKKLREELQTQFVKNQEEIHNLKLKHQAEIQVLELKNQKLEMALDLKNQKYENALQAHNDLLAAHFQRNNSQS